MPRPKTQNGYKWLQKKPENPEKTEEHKRIY
jgi:hypothetical protein